MTFKVEPMDFHILMKTHAQFESVTYISLIWPLLFCSLTICQYTDFFCLYSGPISYILAIVSVFWSHILVYLSCFCILVSCFSILIVFLYSGLMFCYTALRKESSQTNIILQYKLLTSILSAVCSVIQQS